jgi:cold-inducible RNA-binding protein
MSINIYVGNLSFDASEGELKSLFESYGEVDSAKIIVDQFTGRSRGFGFIEMRNREEGLKAIQELDTKDLKGRSLKVNEARPRTSSGGGGGRRDGGGGGGGGRSRW